MVKFHNILAFGRLFSAVFFLLLSTTIASSQSISVFAGSDTTLCQNSTLTISELNASISGLVNDGFWFTTGDGFFDPGAGSNVQFSLANSYFPGPNDIVNGTFSLILSSFDPDGNGPAPQVNDTVKISLSGSPALACHGSLNVSLSDNCTEIVTPQMVLTSPVAPFSHYIINLVDEAGDTVPDNILTVNELNQNITFTVGHLCGNNSCWGILKPQDKKPPVLICSNFTISCDEDRTPASIGFPVPANTTIDTINEFSFNVKNLDSCSDVLLNYSDTYQDMSCLNGLQERIIRKWIATDASGNSTQCTQVISVITKGIIDVVFPQNYNDNPVPSLECDGNWPQLPNGNPTPEYTGSPEIDGCKYLEKTYTDIEFELCGNSYKVLRKWLVIDWCTNETKEHNQVIKIADTTRPQFNVIDSLVLFTSAYDCFTLKHKIPVITNLIDCSDVDTFFQVKDTFNQSFNHLVSIKKDTFYIDSLPTGFYVGSYIVKDACNNIDTNSFPIRVLDNKVPFAICDQFTKISIITNGTARLFAESLDDNSVDNCEIDSFSVAKMEDICNGTPNVYKSYVDFCCAETANPVMVALKVTDIYGNENTCMSQVTVDDKEVPIINCPSNITINCNYDYTDLSVFGTVSLDPNAVSPIYIYDEYNNGFAGSNGLATDNCIVNIDSSYTENIDCYLGNIYRTFSATDLFGNQSTCTQNISIINLNPFTREDIIWPANIEIDGCDTSFIDINLTKEPTYNNIGCAKVEATFEDQYFTNTTEACIKVLRTWSVIDWCTFDSNTGYGLYNYVQIIKLTNDTPPVFDNNCTDTIFCMYSNDCQKEQFVLDLNASDDCTSAEKLNYYWEVDEFNDGLIEHSGISNTIDILLPQGVHTIYSEVVDQCGNVTFCNFNVDAKDCKNPTPYCVSNLSTVIMPSSKELEIIARSFDYDSYDNCTPKEDLLFSFSSDITDSTRLLTCNDIENGVADVLMITMYVTDQKGNQDYCVVELAIQDNDDVCQDIGSFASINGSINSFNNKPVQKVEVRLTSGVDIYNQSKLSDSTGLFTFTDLPTTLPYVVEANYDGAANEGLSTLDLVLLQRHILGIAPLTSPYKILAGDANGSKKLNVSDLVVIRKVLLGVVDNFGPNVNSWEFIDEDFVFDDPKNPWNFDNEIQLSSLNNGSNNVGFVGVKIGDVNGSISNFRSGPVSTSRNILSKSLIINSKYDTHNFSFENTMEIDGFQINLTSTEIRSLNVSTEIEEFTEYFINGNDLSIICYLPTKKLISANDILFTIDGKNISLNKHTNLNPEVYIDQEAQTIDLISAINTSIEPDNKLISVIYKNGQLIINNEGYEQFGSIAIINTEGRLLFDVEYNGQYSIEIPKVPTGIYICSLQVGNERFNYKIFIP